MSIEPTLITDNLELPQTPPPQRICGMADTAPAGGLSRWEASQVTYANAWTSPKFDVAGLFAEAAGVWNAVCGVNLVRHGSPINIIARSGKIDGNGGTLAWSYFPDSPSGPTDQVEQLYDVADSESRDWLLATVIHEFGHAIGIPHSSNQADVMYPYSAGKFVRLGPGDIAEAQRRYGKPKTKDPLPVPVPVPVPPTLPPATPKTENIVIRIGNQSWEIDARRLPEISGTSASLAMEGSA